MKSSSKQQTAMTRRSRQQKQPQVETHEQSHKEEIIIAVNDSDDHQIVNQQSPIETQIVIPDVVSNDKNDIKPGNISDDECIYDEEEMAFALHGLPDIEKEVKLNYGDALFCFSKASEFAEGNPLKSAKSEGVSQYFTGHVLRIIAESEVILKDQRAAIMAGIDQTTVDSRDSLIAKKWNIPIEVITVTEEEIQVAKRAVSGGPGRKEERQSTKKSGVSTSKAASNISVSKENPVQKEGTTSTLPVTFPGTISCDIAYDIHDTSLVRQSVTVLLQGAINAYVCNEYQLLSNIMREISHCAVLKGNTTLCGQAIEYAQGAAMNHYLHTLWAEITAPDTPEASIVRLISHLRKTSAHIETSSHFKGILNSLDLHSPMHARLSLPEPTFSHTEALGTAKANLPVDFCSLTFHLAEALNIIGTEITCTFRRPNGHLANRRMVVSTDTLDELCQRYELISVERQNQLSGPSARDPEAIRKLDSKYSEYIADTETFLSPLLDDGMRAAMHAVAQNCHLVILLHPVLMPLPFEGMYDIMKFKTVSRDISVFSTIKRINRKMTETKLPVQQAKFAVDPFNENNKLSHLVMFGEEKPQNSNWSLLGSSIDQHGLSHPIQSGRIVKEISCSQGVAPITNTLVVNMPGRFTGLLPLSELAPLSLEHLRAVFIIDKSVIEKAIRRENQQNMNKTYHILRHETNFWTIPLLMLARGVDFCMINALPGTPTFTDSVGRAVVLSLERPSHFIEAIGTAVGRQSQIKVDQTEEVPNIQPASVNRFSTVLSGKNRISTSNTLRPIIQYLGMEKFNLKFFGVSPVDETSIPLTSNVKR